MINTAYYINMHPPILSPLLPVSTCFTHPFLHHIFFPSSLLPLFFPSSLLPLFSLSSSSQVCRHPFFWDSHKRLEFLVSISDRLEQESVISSVVLFLESKAHLIIGQGGWDSRGKALAIDPCLLSDMNKYRKYDTHCVRDLLRVIRNKKHHFHELSSELRAKLKLDLPLGFLAYFENRFPRLLLRAVEVACTFFSEEKDFAICRAIAPMFREEREKEVAVGPAAAPSTAACAVSVPYTVPTSASASVPLMNAPIASATPSSSSSVGGSLKASGTAAGGSERLREESLDGSASASDTLPSSIDPLNVVVWHGGALSTSLTCRGWWRKIEQSDSWSSNGAPGGGGGGGGWTSTAKAGRPRPMHLIRASTDLKYRTRLCTHWEQTVTCPMRKKG